MAWSGAAKIAGRGCPQVTHFGGVSFYFLRLLPDGSVSNFFFDCSSGLFFNLPSLQRRQQVGPSTWKGLVFVAYGCAFLANHWSSQSEMGPRTMSINNFTTLRAARRRSEVD